MGSFATRNFWDVMLALVHCAPRSCRLAKRAPRSATEINETFPHQEDGYQAGHGDIHYCHERYYRDPDGREEPRHPRQEMGDHETAHSQSCQQSQQNQQGIRFSGIRCRRCCFVLRHLIAPMDSTAPLQEVSTVPTSHVSCQALYLSVNL